MGGKSLVIVESPTKAKTITKFLGKEYTVKASNGHIRDLPNSAAEIPAKLKKEAWAKLGVNIEADFEPLYVIPKEKKEHVSQLKEAMKGVELVLLATDEDREGESISWHLLEALQPKVPVKRLVFHEITKDAIRSAIESPRDIDMNLVRAQETRRIVDRLFGYEVSPLLWKKMAPRLSAGRVQSVAIRLLADRERERIKFKTAEYWSLKAKFEKPSSKELFEAELTHVRDVRIASGKDFDPERGTLKNDEKVTLLNKASAEELLANVRASTPIVSTVEEKPYSSSPPAPFVTSSLQQEANRKLRFSAQRTMRIAQQLYENGFITYMRTDSTTLSGEALNAARTLIERDFGKEFLPEKPRVYMTKVKNAQEAHEAIRPAGESFSAPDRVKDQLGEDAFRLYELIWKRTVASQMQNATGTHISVHVAAGPARFRASGKTIEFPGFLRAYVEGTDDPEAELADRERVLPKLKEQEELKTENVESLHHQTQPPARYTEGTLIRELERRGIGRPSTWASIVELVLSRSYAFKKGTALVPTFTAMAVVGMLEKHFANLLDYDFTARLEDDLDAISRGESANTNYLRGFYFGNGHPGLRALITQGETAIDPREVCAIPLGDTSDGKHLEVRIGKYGPFLTNGEQRASVPENVAPDELTLDEAVRLLENAQKPAESLGLHPETGESIFLKVGPYGPYVQLGEGDGEKKPKMASLLTNMTPDTVTLDDAVLLLSLPRTLGIFPDNQEKVIAANGRFGPYVKAGVETRSISLETYSPLTITFEQAVELLKQPKARGRASSKPTLLRELGEHPTSKVPLKIMSGRYGPYVSDGTLNASLPKNADVQAVTIPQAVELLEARAEKEPVKRTRRRRKG